MSLDPYWGDFASQAVASIPAADLTTVYRAQSILHGVECDDGDQPILPPEQAADVVRWAGATR